MLRLPNPRVPLAVSNSLARSNSKESRAIHRSRDSVFPTVSPSDHRSPPTAASASPPALIVFTLGAAVEARRRALLPNHAQAAACSFYQATLDRTLSAGRGAGLAVAVASPGPLTVPKGIDEIRQPSGTFSERLIGSIALARGASDRGWVVVGSDCPDLDSTILQRVAERLASHPERVILGPAEDGGVYLIAANGCPKTLLTEVSWGHRRTRESLHRALMALGIEVEELPPLADIDDRSALRRWLASGGARSSHWADLSRVLLEAIRPTPSAIRRPLRRSVCTAQQPWAGRAPPL